MDKESDISRTLLANFEQEDTPAFPGTTNSEEPARALRMSDSFFVSDTLDEDESIIPPTQELLIPSTPPPKEKSSIRDEDSSKMNDTTLSNLDETVFEDQKKDEVKESPEKVQVHEKEKEVIDIASQNDFTQDLMDLDATQELLVQRPDPAQYVKNVQEVEMEEDDDDWNLRFTDTETQELITSSKLKELEGSNQMSTIVEEPSENAPKETSATPPVENKEDTVSPTKPEEKEGENDSEDEIAPSQSCLEDYQADTHLTYLERMSQNSSLEPTPSHSTPDANSNGKPPPLIRGSEDMSTPSPIPLNPIPLDISDPPTSLLKPVGDESLPVEKSSDAEVSVVGKEVLEQCSTPQPTKVPEVINIAEEKEKIPSETIDLLSSVDQTAEVLDIPEVVEPVKEAVDSIQVVAELNIEVVVPVKEVAEPIKEVVESMKEVVESVKEVVEPVKEVVAPSKEVAEPSKENVEPVKEAAEKAKEDVEEKKPVGITNEEQEKISNAYMSKVTALGNVLSVENSEDIKADLPDTEPNFRLPLPKGNLSLGRKPRMQRTRKAGQSLPNQVISEKKLIGKFEDITFLKQLLLKPIEEHALNQEYLENILSLKSSEEMEVNLFLISVKNNSLFLTKSFEKSHPDVQVSPQSGSSSSLATINSNHSSNNTSLPLGELADLSSFSSGKSASHPDTTTTLASQDPPKTSTQVSVPSTSFSKLFKGEENIQEDPEEISPIKPVPPPAKGRRGRKPAAAKAAAAAAEKPQPTAKRRRGRAPKAKGEEKVVVSTTDSEVEVLRPKRRKYQRKEKTVSLEKVSSLVEEVIAERSDDISSDSPSGNILPGVRVMARWRDGYFYPGVVLRKDSESRWEVQFEDNQVDKMSQENLIKVSILEIGTSVLVQSENKYYEPGIICGHFREGYEVELDRGVSERFPRTKVILSSDQAKLLPGYQPSSAQATSAITLDNLVTGKRKRRSAQSPEPLPASKKPTRSSRRLSKTEPNLDSTDTSEVETVPGPSTSTASTSTGRGRRRTAATSYKDSSAKDPNLFKDFAFILSTTEKRSPVKSYDSESCSEEDNSPIPFNKEEICSCITPRGGIILHKFEAVQKCKRKYIYLLAETYLRTMKYIQCLTVGIPCIRHHWVYDCCFKKEILAHSSYTLPAGFSIITNQIVEWHGQSSVLEGKKIFLISAPENSFTYTWSPVLTAAKAKIVQKLTATTAKSGVDVIVSNKECPADVLKTAKLKKIPIVSSEWVIQSLINGRVLKYDEHPHFRYDYNPV